MKKKDIAIIGGGLSGLTAAIHLAAKGLEVVLYEKEEYPFHKVCGEYLSKEILPYLDFLSLDLFSLEPAIINHLVYSTPSGKTINAQLPLGGLGISRYTLDNYLFRKAEKAGVEFIKDTVKSIEYKEDHHFINIATSTECRAKIVLGAFGKRSLLDKKLERDFIEKKTGWLAVKAHYKNDEHPENVVSLHNFKGGYCGLSRTETGAVNVCYLATYKSFKEFKDPQKYKEGVLFKNPELKRFFQNAVPLFEKDITIAQIFFEKKSIVENHVLMLGDAAGMIYPLCGNGMAMAIHSAKIASEAILKHYKNDILNRELLEWEYSKTWNEFFNLRIRTGRALQKVLLNPVLAEVSQNIIKTFPSLLPHIIHRTHGRPVK